MHFEINALNFRSVDAMLVAQLYAGVDAGVNDNAAGKRLIGIERNFKTLPQFAGDLRPIMLGRHCLRVTTRRFECT